MSSSSRHLDSHDNAAFAKNALLPIQGLWIGMLGPLEQLSMASFIAHGHEYHLYCYEHPGAVPAGVTVKDARDILPQEAVFTYAKGKEKGGYSAFADLFRYKLLAEKGGWWADTDVICLKPFHTDADYVFASEHTRMFGTKMCIAVMKSLADSPVFTACYESAAKHDPKTLRFAQNGAPIVTKWMKHYGLQKAVAAPETYNPINWWNSAVLAKSGSASLLNQMQDGLHCYAESWRWRMKDRRGISGKPEWFPADTILGVLQRRYMPDEEAV